MNFSLNRLRTLEILKAYFCVELVFKIIGGLAEFNNSLLFIFCGCSFTYVFDLALLGSRVCDASARRLPLACAAEAPATCALRAESAAEPRDARGRGRDECVCTRRGQVRVGSHL